MERHSDVLDNQHFGVLLRVFLQLKWQISRRCSIWRTDGSNARNEKKKIKLCEMKMDVTQERDYSLKSKVVRKILGGNIFKYVVDKDKNEFAAGLKIYTRH